MFSLVFVLIIHMRSDTGMFVFSVVIVPIPRINFGPLPELFKLTFFPSDKVNSCNLVS